VGNLYHAVEFWESSRPVNDNGVIPGWVGFVFFSLEKSLKALKGYKSLNFLKFMAHSLTIAFKAKPAP
jgi:hypothetical protein